MIFYLCDQQLYVLFKAVQESLQGAGVGSAALSCPNLWQSSMFVLNLGQNLKKEQKVVHKCSTCEQHVGKLTKSCRVFTICIGEEGLRNQRNTFVPVLCVVHVVLH